MEWDFYTDQKGHRFKEDEKHCFWHQVSKTILQYLNFLESDHQKTVTYGTAENLEKGIYVYKNILWSMNENIQIYLWEIKNEYFKAIL